LFGVQASQHLAGFNRLPLADQYLGHLSGSAKGEIGLLRRLQGAGRVYLHHQRLSRDGYCFPLRFAGDYNSSDYLFLVSFHCFVPLLAVIFSHDTTKITLAEESPVTILA